MANILLHTKPILEKLVTILIAGVKVDLGLKHVQKGGLEYINNPKALISHVPMILVKPSPTVDIDFSEIAQSYRMRHRFRIVYVRKYATTEAIVVQKVEDVQKITDLLLQKIDLDSLSLDGGVVEYAVVDSVEWEPPEDELAYVAAAQISVAAINHSVWVLSEE